MRNITVEQVMTWRPGYDRAKVEALIGDGKTAQEIGALDIPVEDRVWALIHALRDAKGLIALCDAAGTFALRAHYHAAYAYYVYAAERAAANTTYAANAAAANATYATYAANADYAAAYASNAAERATAAATYAANAAAYAYYAADAAYAAAERAAQISYLVEEINA